MNNNQNSFILIYRIRSHLNLKLIYLITLQSLLINIQSALQSQHFRQRIQISPSMNKLSAREKQTEKNNSARNKLPQSLSAKPVSQLEMIAKFKQDLQRRKEVIQKLYQKSVPNQIYSFPRHNYFFDERDLDNESTSNQSSLSDIEPHYDLKKQNKKNKKGQTNTGNLFSSDLKILCKTQSNYQSIHTDQFKNPNDCSAKKNKKKKTDINYHSRNAKMQRLDRQKSVDKSLLFQSSKKVLAGQHSLGKAGNITSTFHKSYSTVKPKQGNIHISLKPQQILQKQDRPLKIKKHKSKDKVKDNSIMTNAEGGNQSYNSKNHHRNIRINTQF